MIKLPVGQTIRFAYAFTFGEIGTVIGLIWIPTLINAVASFFVFRNYYSDMASAVDGGTPVMGQGFGLVFLYSVAAVLIFAMIAVAISRQALGLRQGPAFAHVSLGSAELRVFGGFFGLYMLLLLFVFALALAVALLAVAGAALAKSGAAAEQVVGGAAVLLGLAGFVALFYVFIRLSFLFIPSAVNEGEFGLTRSWELTRGNFWRIVAVGLATLLPAVLIVGAIQVAILGPDYFTVEMAMISDPAHAAKHMAEQMRLVSARMPLILGLGFVVTPVTQGLLFAPAAFAYKVLSGKTPQPQGR
ncbi:MAG TPA: hypothetical protein VNU97_03715 [Rhizomicrobium sp.]|jgi:hypothetical protein|nr:hypothetical protein [Rhizomicrobium sp.]